MPFNTGTAEHTQRAAGSEGSTIGMRGGEWGQTEETHFADTGVMTSKGNEKSKKRNTEGVDRIVW